MENTDNVTTTPLMLEPLLRECPTCGVQRGQFCLTPKGKKQITFHSKR